MKIDWNEQFRQQPQRYEPTYNHKRELVQVIDRDTGYLWFKVGADDWEATE